MEVKRYRLLVSSLVPFVLLSAALIANTASGAASTAVHNRAVGVAARTMAVNESSHLHLVSHHGAQVLNEQGSTSGTPGGSLTIHVNIAYTRATITFTTYPHGGVLSGQGEATYYAEGSTAHFTGTVKVTHGSGRFAHASANNLRIEGKLERNRNYALYVKVVGQMRY